MNTGRRDYETRRQARVERLRARAEKVRSAGMVAHAKAEAIAERFWMGQPILVGHHSEKKARRDQQRMHDAMGKSVAAVRIAEALERRANSADANYAISSDDPNALQKLREKLTRLEEEREACKELNLVHRKGGWKAVAEVVGDEEAKKLIKRAGYGGHDKPYPPYSLTNLGAEIRRVAKRIEDLEKLALRPERVPVTFGDIEVREEDNRVMLLFPGKPSEEVRKELKSQGFRWAPSTGAWQRMASERAWYLANRIAKSVAGAEASAA